MAPDAIPVRALASVATLPPDAIRVLFGAGATLRGTEWVELVHLGQVHARIAARAGDGLRLHLDALDRPPRPVGARATESPSGLRLQGPVGALDAPTPQPVRSTLTVPEGLKAAWRMGDEASIGLGPLAVRVPVGSGDALALGAERALFLAAGSPETARWLPQTTWRLAPAPDAPAPDPRVAVIAGRLVTETDVRQARLKRQRIRLAPGQIVTPAARSLAREWNVFLPDDA